MLSYLLNFKQQPQTPIAPRAGFSPNGVWIPAYATKLWTPQGFREAATASSERTVGPGGHSRTGNGSSTLLDWTISQASRFPMLLFGVFVPTDTSTVNQTAVGIGDSAVVTGGLYGSLGQYASASSISGLVRMHNGGPAPEVVGPAAAVGQVYSAVRISRSRTSHVMYVNGLRYSNSDDSGAPDELVFGHFSIGAAQRVTTPIIYGKQGVLLAGYAFADPGDAWMWAFSTHPWGTLFAPRRIWVPQAAAAATPTLADLRAISVGATSTQWSIDYTF